MLAILILLFCSRSVWTLSCAKSRSGKYEFFDGDKKIIPEVFRCLRVTVEVDSTLAVSLQSTKRSSNVCRAVHDGKRKTYSKYDKVAMNTVDTGVMCTYECREQTGQYRCTSEPSNRRCECEKKGPNVVIAPISSDVLLGQSEQNVESGCEDKEEGFQYPDAVPCISVRAEVTKKRVAFKNKSRGKCTVKTETRAETRFIPAAPAELTLQGCLWVCKKAAPRCTANIKGGECNCASPGLQKVLVLLNEDELNGLVRQSSCELSAQCGPCGVCVKGRCMLKENAREGNNCPCGMICPATDKRSNPGAQLLCIPNTSLLCMAEAHWMDNGNGKMDHPGEEIPDFCREGVTDSGDYCGCRDGYIEYLKKEKTGQGSVRCKKA